MHACTYARCVGLAMDASSSSEMLRGREGWQEWSIARRFSVARLEAVGVGVWRAVDVWIERVIPKGPASRALLGLAPFPAAPQHPAATLPTYSG
jgi:hypothetical protein